MSFENPLDFLRNKVNKTVNESRLPSENYESTVGIYGGKLKRDDEGKLVYNMRGLISKIDQFGDAILRTYDEHLVRNPFELLKKHPKLFLKFIAPGTKRYRGNKEEIFDHIKELGLDDVYGLHEDGIEIKDEEIYTKGFALQDIYRADIINSDELQSIDRFHAILDSAQYIKQIHKKCAVGEVLPSDIIFREKNEGGVGNPILNIPDLVFNKEKNVSEDHKKTIDMLDFLMSIGFEEMRRSNEDKESIKKAMTKVLEGYDDREMVRSLISFIKRGYLTLQGDKDIDFINLEKDSITTRNRGVFTKHNEARMGKNDRNYETVLKILAIEVCNEYLEKYIK